MKIPDATRTPEFDLAMRARWQLAARHLPAEVAWRLQPGIAATRATAGTRDSGRGLLLAGAMAAVFALALGLRLQSPQPPAPAVATTGVQAGATTADAATALDEDPDFYAWLGSDEAQALAME